MAFLGQYFLVVGNGTRDVQNSARLLGAELVIRVICCNLVDLSAERLQLGNTADALLGVHFRNWVVAVGSLVEVDDLLEVFEKLWVLDKYTLNLALELEPLVDDCLVVWMVPASASSPVYEVVVCIVLLITDRLIPVAEMFLVAAPLTMVLAARNLLGVYKNILLSQMIHLGMQF